MFIKLIGISLVSAILMGMAPFESLTSPACRGDYTGRGDNEAKQELLKEYRAAIKLAQKNKNRLLLSQLRKHKGDFLAIETWTCAVHKAHGRP